MTEWFDAAMEAKARRDEAESVLVDHLARGPWGTELLKLVVRYLSCEWQMEINDGRYAAEAEGFKAAVEKLRILGSRSEPRQTKEEENYGL